MLEVNAIREFVETSPVRVRIIETKDVSMEDAKTMILDYMSKCDVVYPDDVADELNLDLKLTIEAVDQLIKDGKIKENGK